MSAQIRRKRWNEIGAPGSIITRTPPWSCSSGLAWRVRARSCARPRRARARGNIEGEKSARGCLVCVWCFRLSSQKERCVRAVRNRGVKTTQAGVEAGRRSPESSEAADEADEEEFSGCVDSATCAARASQVECSSHFRVECRSESPNSCSRLKDRVVSTHECVCETVDDLSLSRESSRERRASRPARLGDASPSLRSKYQKENLKKTRPRDMALELFFVKKHQPWSASVSW